MTNEIRYYGKNFFVDITYNAFLAHEYQNTHFFYKQHFFKQRQAEIGKKLSKC